MSKLFCVRLARMVLLMVGCLAALAVAGSALAAQVDPTGVETTTVDRDTPRRPTRTPQPSPTPQASPTPQPSSTATPAANGATHYFRSNVSVTVSDGRMIVQSDGLPDHATGMFPNASNPNPIRAQSYSFQIPVQPQRAPTATSVLDRGGPIAIAINGVTFYNAYNAQHQDAVVYESFDVCNGHPDPRGAYHYHQNPLCLYTETPGQHSPIIGYAFDGYEIYGLQDVGGLAPTSLDSCGGHVGPTPQHPAGIYHYHVTRSFPYVLGCYSGVVSATTGPRP